ncbi:hypothetical protein LQZ19_04790 [Treponema primitia]|uniref:hypothetical protein n=1 Tax=Treponema primitia TaxID=88058 RepID=UPI00397F3920
MLVIIAMVFLWCGLVPVAGAFLIRRSWRIFRSRFDELCLQPVLDYAACQNTPPEGGLYRFTGGFESLTGSTAETRKGRASPPDSQTLWIRSDTLTIPIALDGAHTYMLPMPEGGESLGPFDPGEESPERIRWDRISTLTEGAKVFVGGLLTRLEDRWTFVSTKEHPLLVIFYDGPDYTLATRAIRAGRHRNEYWNRITPYGFILNAFSQISIAAAFLPRPAFRLTVITAVIALFAPLLPLLPPGVLLTVLYRRLWWRARIFRAYRDLARLPLKYFPTGILPNGESYGAVWYEELPAGEGSPPLLIPEQRPRKGEGWYVFGALPDGVPVRPRDPCAAFGAIPGEPEILAKRYTQSAYILEIAGGLFVVIGMAMNILFITMIFYLLQ